MPLAEDAPGSFALRAATSPEDSAPLADQILAYARGKVIDVVNPRRS